MKARRKARNVRMDIKPIRNEAEYDAALRRIERYFDEEPLPGTPEADRFDLLALVIGDYEDKRWPIELPDPIAAIEFAMEQRGITRSDLEPIIGSRGRVSEVLNRKRLLTLPMIWGLNRKLKIPADALIRPYGLASRKDKARGESKARFKPARKTAAQSRVRSSGKGSR